MKIGVVIPDRGDRPELLANCLRMLERQTRKPDLIKIVSTDTVPATDEVDITKRYRIGYDYFKGKGFDLIFFIENDDYYACDYIEEMIDSWIFWKRPGLIGLNQTTYYNIAQKSWIKLNHSIRACACNMAIVPDLNIEWSKDNDPFTDIHLWAKYGSSGKLVSNSDIMLGIKHGIGKTGASYHTTRLERMTPDNDFSFLKSKVDNESFIFYKSLNEKLCKNL